VKQSVFKDEASMKIGEALDNYKYFKKTEWTEFTTKQGKEVVEFNGYYNQNDIVVRIQFIINKDRQEDADGVNFRIGFEGYKFLNQSNDESKAWSSAYEGMSFLGLSIFADRQDRSSLMNIIYENAEIKRFSEIKNPEDKNDSENVATPSSRLENSNDNGELKNEYFKWKNELIKNGVLLEKCFDDYQVWRKKSESNPKLPTFAFVEPTVYYYDINNDNKEDALFFFTPDECDGGNASIDQSDYAILIYSKDGQYLRNDNLINTIQTKTQEFIYEKAAIKLENTNVGISKLDNYKIIGNVRSWKSDDGHCCPFFSDSFSFDLTTNQLTFDHQFNPPKSENTIAKAEDTNNIPSSFIITSEKAYFYSESDISTIRKAYLINGQRFLGQKTVNNFVYGIFSNPAGKETKGWIKISDMRKEN
jgi:hypothetical protein